MPVKDSSSKNLKKRKPEWLYAPFMSATHRATGPKVKLYFILPYKIFLTFGLQDLVPVPIDREDTIEEARSQNSGLSNAVNFKGKTNY